MVAEFYSFKKRENSTLRPTVSTWSPEITLKAPCSSQNPKIVVGSQESWETVTSYNYLKLGGRYYYVNQWSSLRNNLWECDCSIDLLATFADDIRSTTAFVEYDTSPNPGIIDTRISKLTSALYQPVEQSLPIITVQPSYILCVTGQEGSVAHVAMSQNALANLLNNVADWSAINVESSEDSVQDFMLGFLTWAKKSLASGNAPQNIRSCTWVPWTVTGESRTVWLGDYNTGQAGRFISDPVESMNFWMDIPWQTDDWRRCALNHTFELYLPYAGVVSLDPGMLYDMTEIVVGVAIDHTTGGISYRVSSGGGLSLGVYSGCAGISVPVGVSNSTLPAVVGGISQVVSTALGSPTGITGLAQSAMNLVNPSVTAVGTQGNGAASGIAGTTIVLTSCYQPTNVSPSSVSAVMGTPTMATKSLAGITGFVKTRGASVRANTSQANINEINSALDRGVYIE